MVSLLVCFSMTLLLYSSTTDGYPTEVFEMEAFFPKEKPILRQLPQNYWCTPRLGKRQWGELDSNNDSEDPTSSDKEKRVQKERKFNTVFIPRTGKRSDALGTLGYMPPHIILDTLSGGNSKSQAMDELAGK